MYSGETGKERRCKRFYLLVLILLFLSFNVLLTGCFEKSETLLPADNHELGNRDEHNHDEEESEVDGEEIPLQENEEILHIDEPKELRVMVVGDIMMHMPQIESAKGEEGFNFLPVFSEVEPIFKEADLVLGNLETTLGGPERGYSGYPRFSAPDELAEALRQVGFDVITTANNHSLDTGEEGLLRTIDQLEQAGLLTTGTFRSQEERDRILIVTQNDISLAILAYTYGTNGIPVPQGKDYLVNLLEPDVIKEDIQQAQAEQADFIAVCIHFGAEYQTQPNAEQIEWVDQLFDWGADLVLGSHPHVLQQYEVKRGDGEGDQADKLVIYSLGNFVSNQRESPRDIGGILDVTLAKWNEAKSIKKVDFIPTYVHRYQQDGKRHYQVLPMAHLLDVRNFPGLSEADYDVLEQRYQDIMVHVLPDDVQEMAEEEGFEPPRRHSTP